MMTASRSKVLAILDGIALAALAGASILVFFFTPMERTMGAVQKVFYFHVAAGWAGMLGFAMALVAGIAYLRTHRQIWDIVEVAAVEIGLIFMLICIVTGSIWAYPTWNTWWTWDPRLTTAAIMELAYAAYLMLRSGIDDPERRARFGAVYAIIAFTSVPLTFFSIRLFNTIHPVVIAGNEAGSAGSFAMSEKMQTAFFISLAAFSLIFIDLFWHRIRLGRLAARVEQLKLKLNE